MTDVELAYKIAKLYENKKTIYLKSSEKEIDLILLSNKTGTLVIDANTKKYLDISRYSAIEDIVDFTYEMNKTSKKFDSIDEVSEFTIEKIVVEKLCDNIASIEVDGVSYNIPDYYLPYGVKESDVLNLDLSINANETTSKKEEMQDRLKNLLNR